LSYLRLPPADYRAISRVCRSLNLASFNQPTFRRLLVGFLAEGLPELANRIRGLRKAEMQILYQHLRTEGMDGVRRSFTPEEVQTLADACVVLSSSMRFTRPLRRILVRSFRHDWPRLSRKVARLSGTQFDRLYEQMREHRLGNV
jgi:hypothetical protein